MESGQGTWTQLEASLVTCHLGGAYRLVQETDRHKDKAMVPEPDTWREGGRILLSGTHRALKVENRGDGVSDPGTRRACAVS